MARFQEGFGWSVKNYTNVKTNFLIELGQHWRHGENIVISFESLLEAKTVWNNKILPTVKKELILNRNLRFLAVMYYNNTLNLRTYRVKVLICIFFIAEISYQCYLYLLCASVKANILSKIKILLYS